MATSSHGALRAPEPPVDAVPLAKGAPPWTETAAEKDARMAWWRAARFGIFIHWGVYSRLEGKWEGKEIPSVGEWIMETGKIPVSSYWREAEAFNPGAYNPQEWADLFAKAGAKYVVITSRHHDGFCLWDSKVSDRDVMSVAAKRDLLMPLKQAVEGAGLKFGLYYSILDWTHHDYTGRRAWNDLHNAYKPDPDRFELYVTAQLLEIIRGYDPAVVWFDGEWEDAWDRERGLRIGQVVRNNAPRAIVNNRFAKGRRGMSGIHAPSDVDEGDFGTPEQEIPKRPMPGVDWETCLTMNDTWGYKANDKNFKSSRELIRTLVDVASKGGNLLLNVGPDGEGRIPETSVKRLLNMGEWLAVNGESIYGTRAGPISRLPYGRTTQRDGVVYVHIFDWPSDGKLPVPGLRNEVTGARIVGSPDAKLKWSTMEDGVWIELPSAAPDADDTVIAVSIKGAPVVVEPPKEKPADGSIVLVAEEAALEGEQIGLERKDSEHDNIGYWLDPKASATWSVDLAADTEYDVSLVLACQPGSAGDAFEVVIGKSVVGGTVPSTGSWEEFKRVAVGRVKVKGGKTSVMVRPAPGKPLKHALMNLQEVRLTPVK